MEVKLSYAERMASLYAAIPTLSAGERRERYEVRTRQESGLRSVACARGHEFSIDEPEDWGSDMAANPAELALAALGASLEVRAVCTPTTSASLRATSRPT